MADDKDNDRKIRWCSPEKPSPEEKIRNLPRQSPRKRDAQPRKKHRKT